MGYMKTTVLAIACLMSSASLLAAPHVDEHKYQGASAYDIPVMQPSKTVLGDAFQYPTGVPLVRSHMIEVAPGQTTSWHSHAVPLFVYVVSGEMTYDYGSRGKRTIKAGDAYIEAVNVCHRGTATGDAPAKIMSVFMGQMDPDQTVPTKCKGSE